MYKRGAVWWVKYYRNGTPMRESTGSTKEGDAKRLLKLREGDIERGLPVSPQMNRIRFDEAAEDLKTDFAYITGWRIPSEVLPLQWRQVDFEAGVVRLDPHTTKNDEGWTFPFTDALKRVLEAQRAVHDRLKAAGVLCPWVFNRSNKKVKGKRITSKDWRRRPDWNQGWRFCRQGRYYLCC